MGVGSILQKGALFQPLPIHICSLGRWNSLAATQTALLGGGGSTGTWPAANRAIYIPLFLPAPFVVARFMVTNVNTTGTVDIGLYNAAGTRLLSTGNTARSGSNVTQYFNVTDTWFPAGSYFIALVCSSASGTFGQISLTSVGASHGRSCGVVQEDLGSAVLPASVTPAAFSSTAIWDFGFTQSDTI